MEEMRGRHGKLSLWHATSLGIGLMIGAGLFALVGIGAEKAGSDLTLSFILSGVVALLVAYNYAKLSKLFVSNAGPIEYISRGLGDSFYTGFSAFIIWLVYVSTVALLAQTFTGYTLALIGAKHTYTNMLASNTLIILAFFALNFKGSYTAAKTGSYIVIAKMAILIFFIAVGILTVNPEYVDPHFQPHNLESMLYVASLLFLSYTGFGLITTASEDIENPRKNVPLAIYLTVIASMIIYVGVVIVTIGNLPIPELAKAKQYALAAAAQPFLGKAGFILLALGAMITASSAINSSIYGGTNIGYALAKKAILPRIFMEKKWLGKPGGFYITVILALLLALGLDLEGVAVFVSASYTIVYLGVIIAHLKLKSQTKGNTAIITTSLIVDTIILGELLYHQLINHPLNFITVITMYTLAAIAEYTYKRG